MATMILASLASARRSILLVASLHVLGVGAGMTMVHQRASFALSYRDQLVARAHREDPSARANDAGHHLAAAAIDFSRNLGLVAIPDTVGGLTLVLPLALASYRGWVGGIVSVDSYHESRLNTVGSATYFVTVLLLQLTGFTLAGGAGVHLGWSFFRVRSPFVGPRWFRLPKQALIEVAWLYSLIVPIFFLGSLLEFLWPAA